MAMTVGEQIRKRGREQEAARKHGFQPAAPSGGPALKSRPDPTYDATSVPAAVPLPTNQPPRTTKRSFTQEDL